MLLRDKRESGRGQGPLLQVMEALVTACVHCQRGVSAGPPLAWLSVECSRRPNGEQDRFLPHEHDRRASEVPAAACGVRRPARVENSNSGGDPRDSYGRGDQAAPRGHGDMGAAKALRKRADADDAHRRWRIRESSRSNLPDVTDIVQKNATSHRHAGSRWQGTGKQAAVHTTTRQLGRFQRRIPRRSVSATGGGRKPAAGVKHCDDHRRVVDRWQSRQDGRHT